MSVYLFVCFRSKPTPKKMFFSYTAKSVFKKKNPPSSLGSWRNHSKVLLPVWDFLGDTVCPKIKMHGSFYCSFLKTYLKEGKREKKKRTKRYFNVRTEEITLGVCHRLDRKSHYRLTPELEFQLTTSTTRAFSFFLSDRPPSWKKYLSLGEGKAVPTSLLALGWEFLVPQPLQPGMLGSCCNWQ